LGTTVESVLRTVACFLVLWTGYGLLELMVVLVVARTIQLAVYLAIVRRSLGWRWEWQAAGFRRFVWRWRVFAAENWLATVYTNLDVIVLSFVSGEAAVGLYSAARKFVRLGSVIAKSYTTAIYPVMSRMYGESKESFARLFRHTIRAQCAIAMPFCIGVVVLAHRLVAVVYSEQYAAAAPVLQVSVWGLLLEFLNPFLSHVLFAQGRQHRSMFVAAISLGWNLIATYWLVYYFDAVGAALSCLIGGLIAMTFYMVLSMSRSEFIQAVGSMARVLLAALGMGGVAYLLRDAAWLPLLAASGAIYLLLLFVVQALRIRDLRFFRTTFLGRAAT
jgi:O-antigen/teichoic acid export membrane protein